MKPIKIKSYLIHHILICMAIAFSILGYVLQAKLIPFFPSIEAITLSHGGTQIQVGPGFIPLSHLGLYFSFLCAYLVFEFYNVKPAFYTIIVITLSIILSFGLILFIKKYTLDTSTSHYDNLLYDFLTNSSSLLIALTLATLSGFTTSLVLASGIKKLTRNYLMFIRFPIASILGFAVFTGVYIFITELGTSAPASMLLDALAPFSRFIALSLYALIPLYFLRLSLVLFRGKPQTEEEELQDFIASKNLFKAAETELPIKQASAPLPPQTKQETQQPPLQNTAEPQINEPAPVVIQNTKPQIIFDEPEITVSEKINFKLEPNT